MTIPHTLLSDVPDAELPTAGRFSEADPGDIGAERLWFKPTPSAAAATAAEAYIQDPVSGDMLPITSALPDEVITVDELEETLGPAWVALVDAATVVWDTFGAPYSQARVTLAGNRALDLQNAAAGSHGLLRVTQDATGGRTLTLDGTEVTAITLNSAAGARTMLAWWYDGTTIWWVNLTPTNSVVAAGSVDNTALANEAKEFSFSWTFGDGTTMSDDGTEGDSMRMPCAWEIIGWEVDNSPSGSVEFDVERAAKPVGGAAAAYASLVGAGTPPAVSSAQSDDGTPSDWTDDDGVLGDRIRPVLVDSTTSMQATIILTFRKL